MNRLLRSGMLAGATVLTLAALSACTSQKEDTEAPLAVKVDEQVIMDEGMPGSITTQTVDMTAEVSAIDTKKRTITLEDGQGARRTFTAGPEVVNFDQIEKGDQVTIEYTQETVVYLRDKMEVEEEAVAGIAATAPEGNKPGGVVAGMVEVTAEITALNMEDHTATLKFADGTSQIFPVREDVELKQDQVGREVVMQITTAIAVDVKKH